MNRRTFVKSLAAALTLPATPALTLKPAAAALPGAATPSAAAAAPAAAIANKARFWAIYMNGIQGNCSTATLSTVLNIPEAEARSYLTRLIADGVIKPNPLLKKATAKAAKAVEKKVWRRDDGVSEKAEETVGWQWEDEREVGV